MKVTEKKFRISTAQYFKREFNPAIKTDLVEYQFFLENARWRDGCPFLIEWPYLDVIKTIENKIISCHIDTLVKTAKA
jgi:hypothetical protein